MLKFDLLFSVILYPLLSGRGSFASFTVIRPLDKWIARFKAVRFPSLVLLLYELSLRMHSPMAR
jgi:hypothetical protein